MSDTDSLAEDPDEDLYLRLHSLSKTLESCGIIDESQDKGAYATILDAMNAVRKRCLSKEYDVRNILVDVVPGPDGEGLEVYAKSVKDIEGLLTSMSDKLDAAEGSPAPPPPPKKQSVQQEKTAKQLYDENGATSDLSPLERLRFFCSLAMAGQDWLDVEPFFDDVEKCIQITESQRDQAALPLQMVFNIPNASPELLSILRTIEERIIKDTGFVNATGT